MIDITSASPEEVSQILSRMRLEQEELPPYDGDIIQVFGGSFRGDFDILCRNEDQSVDWKIHKCNLITDYGRRVFAADSILSAGIFTSPCTFTPDPMRHCLYESSGHWQAQTPVTPSMDWGSWTKNWSVTFGVPGFARQIGMVGITGGAGYCNLGQGAGGVICYSLLSPVKTQQASQTLEMSYRLTLQIGV